MSHNIVIYSGARCSYCVRAKELLKRKGLSFTEILIDEDDKSREEMVEKTNRFTIPQIFINDQHIGGYDDLYALDSSGKLAEILDN
ncbi:MAG: glutaredoxin 3 [Legionellaceae bacterium]|nr:glutaredoxin 3 [Legionellaceae bacterium]